MRASTVVLFTAALAASSSLAAPVFREDDSLVARGKIGKAVEGIAKHITKHQGAYKTIGKAAAGAYNQFNSRSIDEELDLDLSQREIDETLEELNQRGLFGIVEKVGAKLFKHGAKHAAGNVGNNNNNNNQKHRRSMDDDEDELELRDVEELAELDERELDDYLDSLDERGLFGIVGKLFKKGAKHGAENAAQNAGNNNQQQQQHRRSLEEIDDEVDFAARGMDDELDYEVEFVARSVPVEELEFEMRDLADEDGEIEMRDILDGEEDLEERSKIGNFFKKIGKGIKKVAGVIL